MNTTVVGVVISLIIGVAAGYWIAATPSSSVNKNDSSEMTQKEAAESGTTEWKIQNAMSAAPLHISEDATILDWPGADGKLPELRKGTSGWTCLPDYPVSPGNDPICVDAMAMQWFGSYIAQKPPKLAQVGIGYMLQGGSDPSNTDPFAAEPALGEDWVTTPPHIMIFPSGDLDEKVYGTNHEGGHPWVMWANTPYAHLMVPVQ